MSEEFEVQCREEEGRLTFHRTLKEALEYAKKDKTVWKISFPLSTGERARLVREYLPPNGIAGWVLRQMEDEVPSLKELAETSGNPNVAGV